MLVVAACAQTEALLDDAVVDQAGLSVERAVDVDAAIARVEGGDPPDVVLLAPQLPDPVRVAQRLHSLDRKGAVVVLADTAGEADLGHALEVAPFLSGDVSMLVTSDPAVLADALGSAAFRTRARRDAADELKKRRDTPPPLSARYLGTLIDSVPIGIVTLDGRGGVIGWNKRTGDMFKVAEVDALGLPFAELFSEDDRRRLGELIDALGSAGIPEQGQVFERHGRHFEVSGARYSIRSGERGSLLILQDVTKRLAAEREVELQRALMAAQADSSEIGITVVTVDGAVERMNPRWTEIWGVDAEMIRADREAATRLMVDQLVDPGAFLAGTERLAASPTGEFRDEIQFKDGRVVERFATHIRSDAGEVVGRIWFHTDITAHRREEDALRFLADATNLLSSSLDYATTLERVADLAVPQMARRCSVEIASQGGHAAEVALVIASGESHVSPSVMIVPIKIRDHVFGAINFARDPGDPAYDEADVNLAEELARRVAIAIDNSLLHAELRDTARTLQESLLPPHLPAVRGFELAARFRPAGAGIQVGGDFYDIFETGPDQWALAVGDVCGKGAEAAALTALTRYTVRAAAMYEQDAGGVLAVLNEALLRQRGDYRFTTLVYCVLDLSGERPLLRVACGGHPQPLRLRADGTAETVGKVGPLLGVLHEAEFAEQQVELDPGDVLALYTDGLTDALAPAQILDEDDLLAALVRCRGASAGEIAQHLEQVALGGDPEQTPRDDIALVVAKLD